MDQKNEVAAIRRARGTMALLLTAWAATSLITSLILWLVLPTTGEGAARHFTAAIAAQFLAWGFIHVVLALVLLRLAQRAQRSPLSGDWIARELADRDKLFRLLRFTLRLNLCILAVGLATSLAGLLMRSASLFGNGVGMVMQGAILLVIDRYSVARLLATARAPTDVRADDR